MCSICKQDPCHYRCPNFILPKTIYYCSACGQGIYNGEEYIVNDNGEYRHYDCFYGIREFLEWLGYEIRTMENDYN